MSQNIRIIEFVGLPGSGKTTLARAIFNEVNSKTSIRYPQVDQMPAVLRVLTKLLLFIFGIIVSPRQSLKMLQSVGSGLDLKRAFNLQYIHGLLSWSAFRGNGAVMLDQGLLQGIWSLGFNQTTNASSVFPNILRGLKIGVVNMNCSDEELVERIRSRSGKSRYDGLSSQEILDRIAEDKTRMEEILKICRASGALQSEVVVTSDMQIDAQFQLIQKEFFA